MGAALAVYCEPGRRQPLALAASKSWVGHAEPAAGLAGLLFAHATATGALALPLMHLRSVNPYVASTLEQQQQASAGWPTAPAPALLPKQGGALAGAGAEPAAWGVSAFAFQGTNAHAVVAAALQPDACAVHATTALAPVWHQKRHYVLPVAHLLIAATVCSGAGAQRRVAFHAELAGASLAYLWDHQVMGKALFPGAASAMGQA